MATTTTIKDRCRLCYTLLKDSSIFHHRIWCSRDHHRCYNIYQRRPHRYRDLIVRYLCIHLPENENSMLTDHYSRVLCGNCASSLDKLDQAFQSFQRTKKLLRSKFRKTSQIVHHQLDQQRLNLLSGKNSNPSSMVESGKEETDKQLPPKRQSKRKGEPKHIDQTMNHTLKTNKSNALQLLVKVPSSKDDEEQKESSSMNLRTSPRRKNFSPLNAIETSSNGKKKFKGSNNEYETSKCTNLLKSSILTDIPVNNHSYSRQFSPLSNVASSSNNRSVNSTKGNHIERIAISLLSGTESTPEMINSSSATHSNGTDEIQTIKSRGLRKNPMTVELSTTNNILCPIVRSPSIVDEPDDDRFSVGAASNDSSATNPSTSTTTIVNGNSKQPSSSISTTSTSEGLAITATNPTGQKQVFMAKQLGNMKKYQCGLCEKIVTNIQIHVRRHTNDKPYPCTYCEKRFTNSGDLQIHVRIHTGEKPYACPLCLKSYRTIGNFNSHVKTHDSGVRPHRCELCNQVFPIPKDWYSHLRSSHRSRTANSEVTSTLTNSKTTTVTKSLLTQVASSQQHNSESFVPSKMKLEPINRSQLIIKSSNHKNHSNNEHDDQEPVNMSKKEEYNDDDDDEDEDDADDDIDDEDETENNHRQATRNLLTNVASPVRV